MSDILSRTNEEEPLQLVSIALAMVILPAGLFGNGIMHIMYKYIQIFCSLHHYIHYRGYFNINQAKIQEKE